MPVAPDDPGERNARAPRAAVALGDELVADAQAHAGAVRVREEAVDAASRVIAHLKLRIDVVLAELDRMPAHLAGPRGKREALEVQGIPAGVVVEQDDLVGSPGEEPLGGGDDIGVELVPPGIPVLVECRDDLPHVREL